MLKKPSIKVLIPKNSVIREIFYCPSQVKICIRAYHNLPDLPSGFLTEKSRLNSGGNGRERGHLFALAISDLPPNVDLQEFRG